MQQLDYDPRVLGIEVYNYTEERLNYEGFSFRYFLPKWNKILRTGRRAWGFFVVDHIPSDGQPLYGRNILLVPEISEQGALEAYRNGGFFGAIKNSGLKFTRISADENRIEVETNQATKINFITQKGLVKTVENSEGQYDYLGSEIFVRIEAFDDDGERIFSQPIMFFDTAAPIIKKGLILQSNGKYVRGTINLRAYATDNVGVTRVKYFLDLVRNSNLIDSSDTRPYSVWLDSTKSSNGTHKVITRAYDAANNRSGLSTLLRVDNYKPHTYAPYRQEIKKGSKTKLYWKVHDPYTGNKAYVTVVIQRRIGSTYQTVKIVRYGLTDINQLRYYNQKFSYHALYRFLIYATDRAGNKQEKVGKNFVFVN